MNYQPKFIENKTAEELEREVHQMLEDEYQYNISIDRLRLWDIQYTLKTLKNK